MKQLLSFALLALIWSSPTLAEKTAAEDIVVSEAFARATIPGRSMGAIFLTLTNHGKDQHLLESAIGDFANVIELHGHEMSNGMMRMRQMAHIHILPGQSKSLKPGGLHIMLMGLKRPLVEGGQVSLRLKFDDGSEKNISVPIKSQSAVK